MPNIKEYPNAVTIYKGSSIEGAADAIAAYLREDNIGSSADKKSQAEVNKEMNKLPQYPLNKDK